MNSNEFLLKLKTLSALIDIPVEEIVVGGGGWFVLKGFQDTTRDLNVYVPEKYLERIAKNEGTYYPKGSSRQALANWFVPIAVGDVTAWVRCVNSYYSTEGLDCLVTEYPVVNEESVQRTQVTLIDRLGMLLEKRGSYAAVKRDPQKKREDFEHIQILNTLSQLENKTPVRLNQAS